ncbi:MAG: hypothetical protein ACFFA4_16855 [Promethearchaeota archaeon]
MDREEIKDRIDFNNIQTKNGGEFLVDYEGNFIVPLSPLNIKMIEYIKILEGRISALETAKGITTR